MSAVTHKIMRRGRSIFCALTALLLLMTAVLPAGAVTTKNAFGMIKDNQQRELVAAAVKNGADVLVFTSSTEPISTGTKGTFSIDGKTKVSVTLESNDLKGSIQRWKVTEKTTIGNSLYETAKPVNKKDAAALYLTFNSASELVKRQTAVTLSGIYGDKSTKSNAAVGFHLKGKQDKYLENKAVNLGLLLDADGKAIGVVCGEDAAWCTWYDTAKASASSGAIREGDSALVSSELKTFLNTRTLVNPNLTKVSQGYGDIAAALAKQAQKMDYCVGNLAIVYRENGLRTLKNGKKIADGSANSLNGSFRKGGGACVDDDSYWYMSLTFPRGKVDSDTFNYNTIALIWAALLADVGADPGGDANKALDKAKDILAALFEDAENTAVTVEDLVFFRITSASEIIVGVDSKNFFRNYPTTIQNFK